MSIPLQIREEPIRLQNSEGWDYLLVYKGRPVSARKNLHIARRAKVKLRLLKLPTSQTSRRKEYMNYTIQEYHYEAIQLHLEEHLAEDHRAVQVIQVLAPDTSCINCYPPRRTSRRQPFGRFWNWYQRAYNALTYSRRTQELFPLLSQIHNATTARTISRDIIFSCTYQNNHFDPRTILSQIFARYTTFEVSTLDPQFYNQYDYYLESEHYPRWRSPAEIFELDSPQTLVDSPLTFEQLIVSPSLPPLILPPPNLPPQMADQALRDAAQAMTALAGALGQGSEKSLLQVGYFAGEGTQDPEQWLEDFRRASAANRWNANRQLELAPVYLKGVALDWFTTLNPAPNAFDDNAHRDRSFKHLFRVRFHTPKQKALWQKQFFEIKQGDASVDAYVNQFRTLKKKIDRGNVFPDTFITQLFIQGLRPEYAINVQASEPADLAAAITSAKQWETGHLMASQNQQGTDQAIKTLTEQIAQLSINLAQKQPVVSKETHYVETPRPTHTGLTCFYCGNTGHMIAKCRIKQEDQRRERQKYNQRNDRRDRAPRSSFQPRDHRENWRDRSRSYDRSRNNRSQDRYNRSRSRSRDPYQDDRKSKHSRASSPYPRNVNYLDNKKSNYSDEETTQETWEAFLENASIRNALSAYLYKEAKDANLLPQHITPVKCNIKVKSKPYQAIIDSGASVSMIAHSVVKELGLKIEQASNSLIVSAIGTSTRPLGIIRNLPIEIEGIQIPITVEVVPATSYSLLLGNDWSKQIKASYNWTNGCYSFKWNNKKYSTTTTYETDQPLPKQPTVTEARELDLYEQEYLTPQELYSFEVREVPELNNDDVGWQVQRSRRRPRTYKPCRVCGKTDHLFKGCPENICRRCKQKGHIAAFCPEQTPKRESCKTCNQTDHTHRQCPHNSCRGCNKLGHLEIDCPLKELKRQNLTLACGCTKQAIEERRSQYYSHRRIYHCCECYTPQLEHGLYELGQRLVCKPCYTAFHTKLDREDPRSIHFYQQGEGKGSLVNCKICRKEEPRSQMLYEDSIAQDLWFCNLEHMYAYKAHTDVLHNPNYNLWVRIKHYTESTKHAGSGYELNQDCIFRLAKVLLEESDQTIQEALEPLYFDRMNHEWSMEEMSLFLRAERELLYDDEEEILQQALEDSFDISHPEFDPETAIANLKQSFTIAVELCKECLMVKHQDELDRNKGTCDECAVIEEISDEPEEEKIEELIEPEPIPVIESELRIQQLEERIQKLEHLNKQLLQLLINDTRNANERAQQLVTLAQNLNF